MGAGPPTVSLATALDWADVAAMLGDYREAVAWLEYAKSRQGSLPPELAERLDVWASAAGVADT